MIIQVDLRKCQGANCKSDAEIESIINTHFIDIELTSAYFDFTDFDNPVHTVDYLSFKYLVKQNIEQGNCTYLQDTNFADLTSNLCNTRFYKVKTNEVYANDNIFFGSQSPTSKYSFYSIDREESTFKNFAKENNAYFKMYIALDQQVNK